MLRPHLRIREWDRDIHIECSKQFKLNSYFYVWAEPAVLGSTKIALKFKYEI